MITHIFQSLKFRVRHQLRQLRVAVKKHAGNVMSHKQGDKYSRFIGDVTTLIGPLRGKRIVEIGSDATGTLLRALAEKGASEVSGINPALLETFQKGGMHLIKGDARCLPFTESSIDLIVSISVLEHVRDLDEVLDEAIRVLVPGGYFYAEFGPIWSAIWGHHLWFYHGGEVVDWRTHPLPPYGHLLMTPVEMRAWCAERFQNHELASMITEFVFHSPDQNRLFYSDYQEIIQQSKFETLMFTGCPDLPMKQTTSDTPMCERLELLRTRYPDKSGFGYHVAKVLLRKP